MLNLLRKIGFSISTTFLIVFSAYFSQTIFLSLLFSATFLRPPFPSYLSQPIFLSVCIYLSSIYLSLFISALFISAYLSQLLFISAYLSQLLFISTYFSQVVCIYLSSIYLSLFISALFTNNNYCGFERRKTNTVHVIQSLLDSALKVLSPPHSLGTHFKNYLNF